MIKVWFHLELLHKGNQGFSTFSAFLVQRYLEFLFREHGRRGALYWNLLMARALPHLGDFHHDIQIIYAQKYLVSYRYVSNIDHYYHYDNFSYKGGSLV